MSFSLRTLFGGGSKRAEVRKDIRSPNDLRLGDFVEFGFLPIPKVSNRRFAVVQINEVDYGYGAERSLVLSDETSTIGLSYEAGSQGRTLILTRLLERPDVETLFDKERFAAVFEKGYTSVIPLVARPEPLQAWLDQDGYEERTDAAPARFRDGRGVTWVSFDYYELEGMGDPDFTIEIEVYDDDTEVYACRKLRPDAIEAYWPAGT